jgi:MFS family permease
MTAQTALLVVVVGFVGALAGVATTQLWQDRRARRAQRRRDAGDRRERLRPGLEPLLRAAIRFERFVSSWSPAWRPVLTEERRVRVRELADDLDCDAEVAEVTLQLEGATDALQAVRDLRWRMDGFRALVAQVPAGGLLADTLEVGAMAAAITASLPDLKAIVLAELEGVVPSVPDRRAAQPARSGDGARPAAPPRERVAWLSSLGPLRRTVFRWLWLGSVASQLGTWVHNVGAVDQMTLLAPTALLLALIQTATSLPGLMLALPAGALADIVDRRRLLLLASAWMCGVSALLSVATFAHLVSSGLLLALTFALGLGSVAGLPAWQAIIPGLVPRDEMPQAVTLSSVAINLARVTGPAVGGLAVALAGPGAAFALTAVAFALTTLVVLQWRRDGPAAMLPAEGMVAAVRFGVRYSLLTAPVRITIIRAAGFILFASALWALMPVVSHRFEVGFAGYSGLLGSLGVGAVASGVLLTRIRRFLGPDALVLVATLAFAATSVSVALVPHYWIALAMMPAAGMAWVCAMSTFNVAAQLAAPEWVRGRVLASYQVTHMGSLAIGSAIWGTFATRLGLAPTMAVAGLLLAGGLVLPARWRLDAVTAVDDAGGAPAEPAAAGDAGPAGALGPPAVPRPRSPVAGRRIGAYLLEASLGAGGLGHVYVARHADLDTVRAVKVMHPDLAADGRLRDRFVRGAGQAARLDHPGLVRVSDCGILDGVPYVVMDLVESTTLQEHLDQLPAGRGVSDPLVRRCVREVAAALDHAHGMGVAHGALRPGNVLIRAGDGRAVLSDLALGGGRADAYAPPERCDGGAADPTPAGDVYAFAAVLHRIATGDPPPGRMLARIAGHPDRPPPPIGLVAPHLPSELEAALSRGLAASPSARYPTAGALAEAYLRATERMPALPSRAIAPVPVWAPALAPASRAGVSSPTGWSLAPLVVLLLGLGAATLAPPPVAAVQSPLPDPVRGTVGQALRVAGLRLTVLSVTPDGQPPASTILDRDQRLVVVRVLYRVVGTDPVITSPYDWTVTDESGQVYGAVEDGIPSALPEAPLSPAATVGGTLAFVVPRTARGLVLHFDAERGYESAEVPLG